MKKIQMFIIALLVISTVSFSNVDSTSAANDISIIVNGNKQSYSDKAIIKGGSTLVPLRGIFEALGASVSWNESTKTIDAKKGDTTVWLRISSTTTKVNGNNVNISVPAQVVSGSTLVPLRFISEALGADVEWNQITKTIKITSNQTTTSTPVNPTSKKMKVHFIDVGQGDSTFVQLATGKNVLIDAGTDQAGETVVAYLKSLGIKELDYVIATHPDADHIGGMVDVMKSFKVVNFIDSGKIHTSNTYENMLLAIQEENAKYIVPEVGRVFEYDQSIESYFQILHVDELATDNNDASIVIKGGYCNKDFLLMADASSKIESNILSKFDNLGVEILKAGHHGSNTSSSLNFLKATKADAVILSYGEDNSYGHPHQEVLTNIKSIGAKAYSTAQSGTIVATIDCKGVSLDTEEFKVKTETIQPTPTPVPAPTPEPVQTGFENCTELKKVYPSGVPAGHAAYQSKMDRDKDGWACE